MFYKLLRDICSQGHRDDGADEEPVLPHRSRWLLWGSHNAKTGTEHSLLVSYAASPHEMTRSFAAILPGQTPLSVFRHVLAP